MIDQKRKIISEVTDGFCRATGASPDSVYVILTDVSQDDWARGGIAFADRDKADARPSPIACAFSVQGEGPPLFLIHGIGAARDTWAKLTPILTPSSLW